MMVSKKVVIQYNDIQVSIKLSTSSEAAKGIIGGAEFVIEPKTVIEPAQVKPKIESTDNEPARVKPQVETVDTYNKPTPKIYLKKYAFIDPVREESIKLQKYAFYYEPKKLIDLWDEVEYEEGVYNTYIIKCYW